MCSQGTLVFNMWEWRVKMLSAVNSKPWVAASYSCSWWATVWSQDLGINGINCWCQQSWHQISLLLLLLSLFCLYLHTAHGCGAVLLANCFLSLQSDICSCLSSTPTTWSYPLHYPSFAMGSTSINGSTPPIHLIHPSLAHLACLVMVMGAQPLPCFGPHFLVLNTRGLIMVALQVYYR